MAVSQPSAEQQDNHFHYSEYQTKFLNGMEAEASKLFPPSLTCYYENAAELRRAVHEWSDTRGALVSTQGSSLKCKRGSAPPSRETSRDKNRVKNHIAIDKQRESKSTRCGCQFVIKYTPAGKNAPAKAVRITNGSFYRHTNGCFPCQSQLIVDKRRAGNYESGIQSEQLRFIIEVLRPRKWVPCKVIRDMMRPLYPDTVAISSQDVCNMRWKCNRILDRMENESGEAGGSGCGISSSDEVNLMERNDRLGALESGGDTVVEGNSATTAAKEAAQAEARVLDWIGDDDDVVRESGGDTVDEVNRAAAAEKEAVKSFTSNDIMEICKDISGEIVKRPDLSTHVGMLLQFRSKLKNGGGDAGSVESCSYEDTFLTYATAFSRHRPYCE
jgi:hypothetical protein